MTEIEFVSSDHRSKRLGDDVVSQYESKVAEVIASKRPKNVKFFDAFWRGDWLKKNEGGIDTHRSRNNYLSRKYNGDSRPSQCACTDTRSRTRRSASDNSPSLSSSEM
jgi:hypothetical protein